MEPKSYHDSADALALRTTRMVLAKVHAFTSSEAKAY